ncbi:MAG TPA: MFS transporter [Candidatus Dormibacteraeota bacterium]|nr:MFS transporter [Candidatus Dormibacteraeota bacterium]
MPNSRLRMLLAANLISLAGYYFFVPLYALFATEVGATPAVIGLLWSFYSLAMAVWILAIARFASRFNQDKLVVLGFGMAAIGSASFFLVSDVTSLALALLVNSLVAGVLLPAYKTVYARNQDKGRESQEWSLYDSSSMLAIAAGSAIGGLIIATHGFTGIFTLMTLVQVLAVLIAYSEFKKNAKAAS